jgi:hypothetical protein
MNEYSFSIKAKKPLSSPKMKNRKNQTPGISGNIYHKRYDA